MTKLNALSRTLLLMRTHLRPDISDEVLLNALTSTTAILVGDEENLSTPEGQHALITAASLIARSGGRCFVDAPNVPLIGNHPPLREYRLVDALLELGADLIPGQEIMAGQPSRKADLALVIGDSTFSGSAYQMVSLSGSTWTGRIGPTRQRWVPTNSPFGALAAAGLAAAEAYKVAMRKLRPYASPGPFDEMFRAAVGAQVVLAPRHAGSPKADLGRFDMVSGGAISQAALYALARIPGVNGEARVIEPDINDITNINRYAFLRRSLVGEAKAVHLAGISLQGLALQGVQLRYEEKNVDSIGQLASDVLVGVDHVESRWAVQESQPTWLGIGATEAYDAMLSFHTRGLPCARCVHEIGAAPQGPIPTAAFISHWAGLLLAAAFVGNRAGWLRPGEQVTWLACLQLGSQFGVRRVAGFPSGVCPYGCPQAA